LKGISVSDILTTDSVKASERLEYWTDMICSTYVRLACDAVQRPDFSGSIVNHQLPGLSLSVVRSCPQRVLRTSREIANSTEDYVIVSIQTKGSGVISQDGRDARLLPGDFAIYDSTRPYVLNFADDFEEIVLKLRGDHLRSAVRGTENLTATTVSGQAGAGHVLIQMIRTLTEEVDALDAAPAEAVASGVVNILVAGLQSLPACRGAELPSMAAFHLRRVKQLIDERLREPNLCVPAIAAQLGISIGHIHRLFKYEPLPPTQYVWNRRLEACARELLDPRRDNASIAEIAFSWGFNNAAHFSRTFRERFRCSPSEWRKTEGLRRSDKSDAVFG
jgi:AraC-like DNA-binding protein